MKANIIYNGENGVHYRDIIMEEDGEQALGKYGILRHEYIKAYKRELYLKLLDENALDAHLKDTDKAAREYFNHMFVCYCIDHGIDNEMRANNPKEYDIEAFEATVYAHSLTMQKYINV